MSEYDFDLIEDAEERPFNFEYLKRILAYAAPYKKTVVTVSLLTLTGIVVGLVEPLLLKKPLMKASQIGMPQL